MTKYNLESVLAVLIGCPNKKSCFWSLAKSKPLAFQRLLFLYTSLSNTSRLSPFKELFQKYLIRSNEFSCWKISQFFLDDATKPDEVDLLKIVARFGRGSRNIMTRNVLLRRWRVLKLKMLKYIVKNLKLSIIIVLVINDCEALMSFKDR